MIWGLRGDYEKFFWHNYHNCAHARGLKKKKKKKKKKLLSCINCVERHSLPLLSPPRFPSWQEIKYMVSKFDLMLSALPAVGALLFVKAVKTVKNGQKLPNLPILK